MEDNVESDIYVQFPSPTDAKGTTSPNLERLWPLVQDNSNNVRKFPEKEPVVILLGWAGAEHKYLSKYSDYYLDRGCIILRYITPLRYHFIETQKLPLLARKILKFITDLHLDTHPIFFHVFSNGGAYTYSYILKEMAKSPNSKLDIKGTIFDSAPCPRNLRSSFKAMLSIFANLKMFRFVAAGLVIFFLICQIFWYHLKTAVGFCVFGDSLDSLENFDSEAAPLTNWLGRIADMRNHNFLFLYSDGDELIPAHKIERFADIVTARGSKVEKVRFAGSEHVMHYRRYPKEYAKAVRDFIQSVMASHQGTTIVDDE